MNAGEDGRTRANGPGIFNLERSNGDTMNWSSGRAVLFGCFVVTAVGVVLLVAGLAGMSGGPAAETPDLPDGPPAETAGLPTAATQESGGENGTPAESGGHLSGLVDTQGQALRGTVGREAFRARLAGSESTEARADLADEWLRAVDGRLAELEAELAPLDLGSGPGEDVDTTTGRAAGVGAGARELDALLDELRAVIVDLAVGTELRQNLTGRLDSHDDRVSALREETDAAAELVAGVGQPNWAAPVTVADVEEAVQRSVDDDSRAWRLFDSERIDARVRAANGSTLRVGIETEGRQVEAVRPGPLDSPTVDVYTDYRVVKRLQRTDDPSGVLADALGDDRIVYDGVGLYDSFRYGAVSIAEWLAL